MSTRLRIGLRSNIWVQARGRPIRGWLLQQLVKLAVAESLSADVLVHADSDVVLLRPFSADVGRRRRRSGPAVRASGTTSTRPCRTHPLASLGREAARHRSGGVPMPDFISSLVPWKRENAVALLDHSRRRRGDTGFEPSPPRGMSPSTRSTAASCGTCSARAEVSSSRRLPSAWTTTSACR